MEHAKKMLLVDPRMLQGAMPPTQAVDPTALRQPEVGVIDMTLRGLDDGLRNILNTPNIPEEQKVKLYSNYLQDYLVLQKKKSDIYARPSPMAVVSPQPAVLPQEAPPEAAAHVEEEVMETVPQKFKKQALLLMERIKRDPEISWNPRGEILVKGQTIADSNLVDLIKDLLQKRKGVNPTGWKTFASHLAQANVPQDLVRNPDRLHYIRNKEKAQYTVEGVKEEEEEEEDLTPAMVQDTISLLESEDETPRKSRKGRKKKKSQMAELILGTPSSKRKTSPWLTLK